MTPRLVAFLIILALAVAGLAASERQATNYGLPLVSAAALDCPALDNPCDTVDCNAVDTQEIA